MGYVSANLGSGAGRRGAIKSAEEEAKDRKEADAAGIVKIARKKTDIPEDGSSDSEDMGARVGEGGKVMLGGKAGKILEEKEADFERMKLELEEARKAKAIAEAAQKQAEQERAQAVAERDQAKKLADAADYAVAMYAKSDITTKARLKLDQALAGVMATLAIAQTAGITRKTLDETDHKIKLVERNRKATEDLSNAIKPGAAANNTIELPVFINKAEGIYDLPVDERLVKRAKERIEKL